MSSSISVARFPDHEEIEHERSTVTIPLKFEDGRTESLELNAFLRLQRYKPLEIMGFRQFEFQVLDWEVVGFSEILGATVGFRLSEAPQPKSVCIADTANDDYPATIVYSAIFDVYVGGECIGHSIPGLGVGKRVMSIPPRDVPVSFQKPFDFGKQGIDIQAGSCTAMMSVTQADWSSLAANAMSRLTNPQD
jgi:hypothetical protein